MLWLLDSVRQISFSQVEPLLPGLSPERRQRIARYRHVPSAIQSALAELLLRHALKVEYGIQELPFIQKEKQGKPFFPELPELHFSLSHCAAAVACVLEKSPVGIDVQEYRSFRQSSGLMSTPNSEKSNEGCRDKHCLSAPAIYRILSEPERAWVEAGLTHDEQDRRFVAVWTCKEAYGKEIGDGILYDLKQTIFLPRSGDWVQYGRRFYHQAASDYALTLCTLEDCSTPEKPVVPMAVLFEDLLKTVTSVH